MKSFYFSLRNPMANINHILATDIPYITVSDTYPNDHNIAQAICDFSTSFDFCARVVSEFTRNLVKKRTGHYLSYDEVISINDCKFYIIGSHAEISKLEKEKIPTFIPKK